MSETSRPIPLATAACYASLYPALVTEAKSHGYALAIHGSMTRDFDLIAVPWTEDAGEPADLIRALKTLCGGVFCRTDMDEFYQNGNPHSKPHGRTAYSIHLTEEGCFGPYLDISVMPRVVKQSLTTAQVDSGA
jgi:hypothetical protein